MRIMQFCLAGMIGIWASGALAHSPLKTTQPADEAVLQEVPREIRFGFQGKIRLTKVTVTHEDQSGTDLDLSEWDEFLSNYAIPFESDSDGEYLIEWRGLGTDGHVMNGSFRFSVE